MAEEFRVDALKQWQKSINDLHATGLHLHLKWQDDLFSLSTPPPLRHIAVTKKGCYHLNTWSERRGQAAGVH